MTSSIAAQAGGPYKAAKRTFKPGQLRKKMWRTIAGAKATDKLWLDRCKAYWDRQAQLFGVKFAAGYTVIAMPQPAEPGRPASTIIVTSARVAEVLPGQRL